MPRRALSWLLALPFTLLLGGVALAARLFAPFGLGRLVQTVSVPRMREHRLRTSFTVLGIALGVAVLVAVVMVSRTIVKSVTNTVGDLAGKADLQIGAGTSGFDESVLDKLRGLPGIYKLTPVVQQTAALRTKGGERERLLILGVDLLGNDDSYFRSYQSEQLDAIRREPLSFLNSPHNIILGRALSQRLGVKVHDRVAINTSDGVREFEVWGFVEDSGVGRAFGGAVAIMYYPAMQVAFGRGSNIDRIDIALSEQAQRGAVVTRLRAILGGAFNVEPPGSRGERVAQMLIAVRTALLMASLLALIAGAFLVVSTMGISVVQRKRELGILRALGTTRRQLVALLTLEGALLGGVGAALGVLLALAISRSALALSSNAVNEIYLEQAAGDVQLDPSLMAFGFGMGILTATAAAFLATSRAGRAKPSEALSAGTIDLGAQKNTRRSDLWGGALLALSFLLLLVPPVDGMPYAALAASLTLTVGGRMLMPRVVMMVHQLISLGRQRFLSAEGLIAADNLPRDLARSASMASGLMAGVSLSVGLGTFVLSFITSLNNWSAQLLPGDLIVASGMPTVGLSGRNTPMDDAIRAQLLAIPGVAGARGVLFGDIDFRGLSVKMAASENPRAARWTMLEGTQEELFSGLERGELAVSENFARRFDVHRGQTIALSTKLGTRAFRVAAVIIDYTSDRGLIRMHRDTYVAHFGDQRVDSYELFLKPGSDPERVRALINDRLAREHDLFVLTTREFRAEFVKAANKLFDLMHVLELVTLAVAMLGMVSALLANVLDRVRELGVLRAVGMLRRQLRKMVTIEATLIGVVGAVGGVLVGIGIGYIFLRHVAGVQIGWHLPYEFPLASILTMLAVTLPLSALSGFYPAQRAALLRVREALDYE